MPLTEYANFHMDREVLERGVAWLEQVDSSNGPARALLSELRAGLDRDRHRKALARIQAVVGPLEGRDALEALATRLEALRLDSSDEALLASWSAET